MVDGIGRMTPDCSLETFKCDLEKSNCEFTTGDAALAHEREKSFYGSLPVPNDVLDQLDENLRAELPPSAKFEYREPLSNAEVFERFIKDLPDDERLFLQALRTQVEGYDASSAGTPEQEANQQAAFLELITRVYEIVAREDDVVRGNKQWMLDMRRFQ